MKSNSSTSIRVVIFFLVVAVVTVIGWLWWSDSIQAVDPSDAETVVFAVEKGESVRNIATRLAEADIIRSPIGFYVLIKLIGFEKMIQAGDFRLNRSMDARVIARELTHGTFDAQITLLEGWRAEEIASKVAKEFDLPEQEFLKYAKEGYLFPDTYSIPRDASAAAIATLLTDTFERKMTPMMRDDIKKAGLTFDEAIILASIVEREGRTDEDRPMIAGILLKRLRNDWPLQADATLQYALGYQAQEKTWWKKSLTEQDKNVASPYNTYEKTGLPPGPISNPGLAAIKAVIYPKDSEYWYYLHDPNGGIHYAETLDGHNANIAKYLRL